MNIEQRDRIMSDNNIKEFLERTRELISQKRSISGAELTIPEVMLDMLRDNLHRYSKLISKVRVKPVKGKARQNIAGAIPEAIWTEAVGKLNELELSFKQVEVDGYKVGGFVPVPNSILEDSDINLMDEIMDMLGQAIGYAVDKAIVYGTGVKMPVGIATRLAETAKPGYWGQIEQEWTDLHVSNVVKIDPATKSKEEFFAELIEKAGIPAPNYNASNLFWVMNRKTFMYLVAKALMFNAAGAIVSAQNNTMPVIGGDVEILEFMSDYDIIGGYGSIYLLAEREGAQFAKSEHVKFIDDQTVFKGTARYDGRPVFGEAFVAINVNNGSPTMSKSFEPDNANF